MHGQDGDLVIGGPASSEIGAASTAGTQGLTAAGALKTDGTCTRKQGAGVDYSKWNSFGTIVRGYSVIVCGQSVIVCG